MKRGADAANQQAHQIAHDAWVEPATGLVDGARRKALAEPILKDLAAWLERERPKLNPSSPIEVAMGYIQRQWTGLTRFLEDGSLCLDNNPSYAGPGTRVAMPPHGLCRVGVEHFVEESEVGTVAARPGR